MDKDEQYYQLYQRITEDENHKTIVDSWLKDSCWNLEDCGGIDETTRQLFLSFRLLCEQRRTELVEAKNLALAQRLNCSIETALAIRCIQERLEKLEELVV